MKITKGGKRRLDEKERQNFKHQLEQFYNKTSAEIELHPLMDWIARLNRDKY